MNHQLLEVIGTFDGEDWKNYEAFSKSLYSDRSDLWRIWKHIKKRKMTLHQLTIDELYAKIRPDLNRKQFQNLISRFSKQVKKYLVWREVQKSEIDNQLLLLRAYHNRGLYEFGNKVFSTGKIISTEPSAALMTVYAKMQMHHMQYFSDNEMKLEEERILLLDSIKHFLQFAEDFSSFYLLEVKNRVRLFNEEKWTDDIEQLTKLATSGKRSVYNLIDQVLQLRSGKDDLWNTLKRRLDETPVTLPFEIRQVLLLHLINHSAQLTKSGTPEEVIPILFDLYKDGINNHLFLTHGRIPTIRFHNIIDVACALEKFEWAENFNKQYEKYLLSGWREDSVRLAQIQILFVQKMYDMAQARLSESKFRLFHHELRAGWLLLCCYYEEKAVLILPDGIRSFKRFLKRHSNNMSKSTYSALVNFAQYINRLISNENIATIEHDFQKETYLMLRTWLAEKIKEKAQP